ncbi:hypothetical protein BT96DRAFT_943390 [Gymnopus androsaceus JB14]|uniref:Uncharacterized protein n=1 Tax=Gymnopus androsaceus JB14 TaxID=1447944 RepID=A0A6A4HAK2_9AGAR|nr:hypothetical protein BT96DRAFT_943390 [Gymnopus androsaceus JB14]
MKGLQEVFLFLFMFLHGCSFRAEFVFAEGFVSQVDVLLVKGGHNSGSRFTWTCDAGNRRAKLVTCDRFQTRGKPVNRYRDPPQILAPMLVLNSKTATIGKVLVLLVTNTYLYYIGTK